LRTKFADKTKIVELADKFFGQKLADKNLTKLADKFCGLLGA